MLATSHHFLYWFKYYQYVEVSEVHGCKESIPGKKTTIKKFSEVVAIEMVRNKLSRDNYGGKAPKDTPLFANAAPFVVNTKDTGFVRKILTQVKSSAVGKFVGEYQVIKHVGRHKIVYRKIDGKCHVCMSKHKSKKNLRSQ